MSEYFSGYKVLDQPKNVQVEPIDPELSELVDGWEGFFENTQNGITTDGMNREREPLVKRTQILSKKRKDLFLLGGAYDQAMYGMLKRLRSNGNEHEGVKQLLKMYEQENEKV